MADDDSRFRDFDAFEAEHRQAPLGFRLGGREWSVTRYGVVSFLQLSAAAPDRPAQATQEFLLRCLGEEQAEAFATMLEEQDIQTETWNELARWLVERMTGRPTPAAAEPPSSPSKPGARSRVVSLDAVSTRAGSASAAS